MFGTISHFISISSPLLGVSATSASQKSRREPLPILEAASSKLNTRVQAKFAQALRDMEKIIPADQQRWEAYYYPFIKAIAKIHDLKFKRFGDNLQAWNSSDESDVGSISSPV